MPADRDRRRAHVLLVVALFLAAACGGTAAPLPAAPTPSATPPPPVVFPRDAGPHDVLTEWWYYTGHLRTADGAQRYGFEFTIFQVRRAGERAGYLAHFAVSDLSRQRFSHQAHVMSIAPRSAFPLDVQGWRLDTDTRTDTIRAQMDPGPGVVAPYGVDLSLTSTKPPALHHGGYIDYGEAGGSYYYSRTRLAVSGEVRDPERGPTAVSGIAWMDHQWGNFITTSSGGWDWYSLQLDDETEYMLYVLRGAAGAPTPVYGSRVLADGTTEDLPPGAVTAEAVGKWTSPHTGATYPSGWRVRIADRGVSLTLRPQLLDQELYFPGSDSGLVYWEGSVEIADDASGRDVGVGYVELTGYAR